MAQENISVQLNDLLASRDFRAELLDKEGRPTDAENADIFTFDYVSSSGKDYGTMVIILDTENEMQVFYGDNLGRSMEGNDKNEFFDFVQHLHKFANMRRWTYSPKNINQVKYTMQGLAAIKEGLFEGYYGTRKVSYSGEPTEARLMIKHDRTLGEADARFRYVESLFIETADSQRFKLAFKNLAGGRAMLEHVRQGGNPYDVRGVHIAEMVMEIATLSRFNRASASRMLEGITKELVTEAQTYYKSLRENMKRMASPRGYNAYFETWHPATIDEQQELVEDIKTLFIEQTLDTRIEAALPLLARIQQQGNAMKEAQIFENWINNLAEGTWSLPETPEQLNRLKELMATELIVGPDATNATEQLYDLIGDDILFDRLSALAEQDPRANAWDDTEVMDRLEELGIQMPETTDPGNPAEPATAPVPPVAAAPAVPAAPVAEGSGPKEKQKTPYRDINSPEYRAVVDKQKQRMAKDKAAEPGKKMLAKQGVAEDQLDEIGNTPAGKAALRAVQNRATDTMDTWSKNSASGYSSTPKQVNKATGAAVSAGNRLHGFGPDRMQQNTVMARDALRKGMAEGAEVDFSAADKVEELVRNYKLFDERGWTDLFSKLAGKKLYGPEYKAEIYRATEYASKFLQLLDSIRMRSDYRGQQDPKKDQELIDLSNQWLDLFNKATSEYKAMSDQGMAESAELNTMLKYAGIPVAESRMLDESGETLDHILNRFKHEIAQFEQDGDLDDNLYDALYDYYSDAGEIPYGIAKARTGDPYQWVSDRLDQELGVNEGFKDKLAGLALAGTVALGSMGGGTGTNIDPYAPDLNTGVKGSSAVISNPGDKKTDIKYQAPIKGQSATIGEADAISTFEVMSGFDAPVAEGSCNMTAEGAYCPEHGLAECGGGSMYESRKDDAVLDRIKSLALLK